MSSVTRKVPTEFSGATGVITAGCPFCCAVTVAESEACGVEETFWDVQRRCSHFERFESMRAVFSGPTEMLEGA